MSLEAHVVPLHVFLSGDFPVPVEKLCRGKGTALMRVARRTWAREPEQARAAEQAAWQAAAVAEVHGEPTAGFHELVDGDAYERLRRFAEGSGGPAAYPHLLAQPSGRVIYLPVKTPATGRFDLLGPGRTYALASAPALGAELDRLNGTLGQRREWGAVAEGELAADARDARYAEKTAWALLRWLAREGERLRLPVIVAPATEGGRG